MSRKSHELFNLERRAINIVHSQMRLNCSTLNSHLFNLHVIESPSCTCGHNVEDNEHFLLNCPLYRVQCNKMLSEFETFIKINDLHVETLLYGSSECDFNINKHIFELSMNLSMNVVDSQ